jgi:hypothetical protein
MRVIYKAETVVCGARHTLRINDIPLSRDMLGQPLAAELPLNEMLVNGQCSIGIELLPVTGEHHLGSQAELTIRIKRFNYPVDPEDFTVVFEHVVEAGALDRKADYTFEGSFDAAVPYKELLWTRNMPIDLEDEGTMGALEQEFEQLWNLFSQQDADAILSLFDSKFSDFEDCYYLPEGDRRSAARRKLLSVFADEGYELGPYNKEWFSPFLSADRRLVSLLDTEQQHYHYINYYHRAKRELVVFPIHLGLTASQEVVVCL